MSDDTTALLTWFHVEHLMGEDRHHRREIHQANRHHFPRMADLQPALAALVEEGILRREPPPPWRGRGRPPGPAYTYVPPHLWPDAEDDEEGEGDAGEEEQPRPKRPAYRLDAGIERRVAAEVERRVREAGGVSAGARLLLRHLVRRNLFDGTTHHARRVLHNRLRWRFPRVADLDRVLAELVLRGHARREPDPPCRCPGRPRSLLYALLVLPRAQESPPATGVAAWGPAEQQAAEEVMRRANYMLERNTFRLRDVPAWSLGCRSCGAVLGGQERHYCGYCLLALQVVINHIGRRGEDNSGW